MVPIVQSQTIDLRYLIEHFSNYLFEAYFGPLDQNMLQVTFPLKAKCDK